MLSKALESASESCLPKSRPISVLSIAYQLSKASVELAQFVLTDAPFSELTLMSLKTLFLIFSRIESWANKTIIRVHLDPEEDHEYMFFYVNFKESSSSYFF